MEEHTRLGRLTGFQTQALREYQHLTGVAEVGVTIATWNCGPTEAWQQLEQAIGQLRKVWGGRGYPCQPLRSVQRRLRALVEG